MYVVTTKKGVKFCERYKDPLTLKWKTVCVTMSKDTAANRKLAINELLSKIADKQNNVEAQDITLYQLYIKYINYQAQTVKVSTLHRNQMTLSRLVEALGNETIVNNMTAQYIKNTLLSMKEEPGTSNEKIKRLKAMLNWGYMNDYISERKMIDKLTLFKDKTHREKIKDKYMEPEELEKVLVYMHKESTMHWYYLTKFLVLSGLRIGEAIALLSSDIDNDSIHIVKTYDVVNRIVTSPKTSMSIRDVYIQSELSSLIKEIRVFEKSQQMLYGYRTELFMSNISGGYLYYDGYCKFLRETSERVLNRRLTPHSLRHTHASLLLSQGVDIGTISRRLGHEDSKVTKEIYLHITKQLIERDNSAIKNIKIL